MKRRRASALALLGFALLLVVGSAEAEPGALDLSFGESGVVTTGFVGGKNDVAYALVLQPDGKLVAVGTSDMYATTYFTLARYEANGALDPSFGSGGIVRNPAGETPYAAVLQPDGKIVVGGATDSPFMLARYNPDGSLDTTFGNGGTVTTSIGTGNNDLGALALQPDGKIVAAGSAGNGSELELARYNADGSLDLSFGSGGIVRISGNASAVAVALQGDGKIVTAGNSYNGSQSVFTLARVNSDGSLDTGYGSNGFVFAPFPGAAVARGLVLQSDGKIVVVGDAYSGATDEFALARYNTDGSLDTGFGSGGIVMTPIGSGAAATAVALQPDGRILAGGVSTSGETQSFTLARYNSDGSLDTTFHGDGVVTTTIGVDSGARALALQADGKVILAGSAILYAGYGSEFALARYLASTLTVSKLGKGAGTVSSDPAGIDCGATCWAPFSAVPVTLTAAPAPGSKFTGWAGEGCSGTDTCRVQMSSDQSVTATFASTPACIVPQVKGTSLKIARRRIKRAHCRTGTIRLSYSKINKGYVISQTPPARRHLHNGAKVNLVISKGKQP